MFEYLFTVSGLFGLLRREMNGVCLVETWLVARSPSAGYTAALAKASFKTRSRVAAP